MGVFLTTKEVLMYFGDDEKEKTDAEKIKEGQKIGGGEGEGTSEDSGE